MLPVRAEDLELALADQHRGVAAGRVHRVDPDLVLAELAAVRVAENLTEPTGSSTSPASTAIRSDATSLRAWLSTIPPSMLASSPVASTADGASRGPRGCRPCN
jgi:hypothetical protein